MKAIAVQPGQKESAALMNMPVPDIGEGEVLVRTEEVGIDGTDMEIKNGEYGESPEGESHLVVGHECLGQIADPAGSRWEKGQLVIPVVRRPDSCFDCRAGRYDMCTEGNYKECGIKGLHGFMREFFSVEPAFLIEVPDRIKQVAVLTEPLSVVEKGVSQAMALHERSAKPVEIALVLGTGSLGLLAVACFRQQNIRTYGLDIVPETNPKAQIVRRLGADYLNGRQVDMEGLPRSIGNLDVIFEATGNSSIIFNALSILGTNGVLCLAGIGSGEVSATDEAGSLQKGFVLNNKLVFGTVSSNRTHYTKAIRLLTEAEERWPGVLTNIITGRFGLEDYADAFSPAPESIKTVVRIGKKT